MREGGKERRGEQREKKGREDEMRGGEERERAQRVKERQRDGYNGEGRGVDFRNDLRTEREKREGIMVGGW